MSTRLLGKTALVTAGSEGLGLAAARHLACAGARVAICSRDAGKLEAARRSIDAVTGRAETLTFVADLTKAAEVDALFGAAVDRLGHVDILVVNSGHMPYGTVEDLDEAAWYESFELLLMSAVRLTRRAVPHMRSRKSGDIVYVTSGGTREASPHLVLSNAFRAGVASMAKTLSRAAAGDNIRVNVVAPGYFDTGRVRRRIDELAAQDNISRQDAARRIAGDIPIGRIGDAEEFGALVRFVVSREVSFMTGSTLIVDGGMSPVAF